MGLNTRGVHNSPITSRYTEKVSRKYPEVAKLPYTIKTTRSSNPTLKWLVRYSGNIAPKLSCENTKEKQKEEKKENEKKKKERSDNRNDLLQL